MSDVTSEEIEKERERAHMEVISVPEANACIASLTGLVIQYKHTAYCTHVATALATVRKEARREALGDAITIAEDGEHWCDGACHAQDSVAAAIRALMEPA